MEKVDRRLALTAKERAKALAKELEADPEIVKARKAGRETLVRRQRDLAQSRRLSA